MKLMALIGGVAAFGLTACATGGGESMAPADSGPASATAQLRDAGGRVLAQATAEAAGDAVRVRIEASGLAQGAYGAHVHAVGRCDAPGFTTAGPHWNPTGQQHGKDNPQGMHRGDLPNLMVGTDGRGSFEYTIPGASLSGDDAMLDGDGAAIVVHQSPDDYRTDPSGNSGARIACGVLG